MVGTCGFLCYSGTRFNPFLVSYYIFSLRSIGIDCTHHFPHSDVAHALAENGVTADDRVVAMDVIGDFQQVSSISIY